MVQVGVESLLLLSEKEVDLPSQGIVVIVGPNNAGKSLLLQEINSSLQAGQLQPPEAKWLSVVKVLKEGDIDNWFDQRAKVIPHGQPNAGQKLLSSGPPGNGRQPLTLATVQSIWNNKHATFQPALAHKFTQYMGAMDRGGLLNWTEARQLGASASEPLHYVEDSRTLESKISGLIRSAFGFPISVNRYNRQNIALLMGQPAMPDTKPPPSDELINQYVSLPPVHSQGDGVRSFVGLLLRTLAGGPYITMIDEPEAFLHPPQAKLLGRYLAQQPAAGGQIIVATHSSDVLEGLLDGASDRKITVLRVSRSVPEVQSDASPHDLHVLPPDRVSGLWSDPLMRYSRMLDGLFHNGVVVCEADNDCRFYSAAIDGYLAQRVAHDLVFTHVGGKGRLAKALQRIRPLHMRAAVITDIDILDNKETLKSLTIAAGGDFSIIEADLNIVETHVQTNNAAPTIGQLKQVAQGVLTGRPDKSALTDAEAKALADIVKIRSGWKQVKKAGQSILVGPPFNAATRVIDYLASIGVFVVSVGELERWFPDIEASHGEPYVTTVLEGKRMDSPPPKLTEFMESICKYFGVTLPASSEVTSDDGEPQAPA